MAVSVGTPDHQLLTRAREGDGEAFDTLYRRHHRAATRAAHSYSSRGELAEDAVQEAFLRIIRATQEGHGPQTEFRAYLATTVRHVIAGWTRSERTIASDDLEALAGEDLRPGSAPESRLRWQLLVRAFRSLPTRWQEALWLGEVEGTDLATLAERWNMTENAASALCYRAREGLRVAWLDAHVNDGLVPDVCRPYVSDLARYSQEKLATRRHSRVREHVDDCDYCATVLVELMTASRELRVLLFPVAALSGAAVAAGAGGAGVLGVVGKAGGFVRRQFQRSAATSAGVAAATVLAVAVAAASILGVFSSDQDAAGTASGPASAVDGSGGGDTDGAGTGADDGVTSTDETAEDPAEAVNGPGAVSDPGDGTGLDLPSSTDDDVAVDVQPPVSGVAAGSGGQVSTGRPGPGTQQPGTQPGQHDPNGSGSTDGEVPGHPAPTEPEAPPGHPEPVDPDPVDPDPVDPEPVDPTEPENPPAPDTVRPTVTLVSPVSGTAVQALQIQVDAADAGGLDRIVANVYWGLVLVRSTQLHADGATEATHVASVTLPDGVYQVRYNARDLAGNVSVTGTQAVRVDTTAPTVIVKSDVEYTSGSDGVYSLVSFSLYDVGQVDRYTLNGVEGDLSSSPLSDIDHIQPGVSGAVVGANTLVVYDVAGNATTITFELTAP